MYIEYNKSQQDETNWIIGLSSRIQWSQLADNSPITNAIRVQRKFNIGRAGTSGKSLWAGAYALSDKTGPTSMTMIGVNSSLHWDLTDGKFFQVGLSLRMNQHSLDRNKIKFHAGQENDDLVAEVAATNSSYISPGWGIFYSSENFYIGASMPITAVQNTNSSILSLPNHIYGVIGGYFPLGGRNSNVLLEPFIWVKNVSEISTIVDANLRFRTELTGSGNYDHPVWVGIGWDSSNTLKGEIGLIYQSILLNFLYGHYLDVGGQFGSAFEGGLTLLLK